MGDTNTQGAGNPWKQDLEIRQILGAPLPDHYWKVPKKESDAWKENEITFKSLMKRLRDSDRELLITMRRARRPMLFSILKNETDDSSIEKQILIVNAGTKSVTEATGIKSTSTMGKKVSSLFKPVDESLDIDKVVFGMCIVVLYDTKNEAFGLVYVFKPSPRYKQDKTNGGTNQSESQPKLSQIREMFLRKIVKDATVSATKKYNEACQQKMLQQVLFNAKIREGRRQMPIETIDSDDESGFSEDAFTIVKSKKS